MKKSEALNVSEYVNVSVSISSSSLCVCGLNVTIVRLDLGSLVLSGMLTDATEMSIGCLSWNVCVGSAI